MLPSLPTYVITAYLGTPSLITHLGMAKAVADVDNRAEAAAGFVSDESRIQGFSQLHDSGNGESISSHSSNY